MYLQSPYLISLNACRLTSAAMMYTMNAKSIINWFEKMRKKKLIANIKMNHTLYGVWSLNTRLALLKILIN